MAAGAARRRRARRRRAIARTPSIAATTARRTCTTRIARATTDTIASGTNRDDLDDFRPGLRAAAEHDVVHPYVEAGIDKARYLRARAHARSRRPRAPAGAAVPCEPRRNGHRDRRRRISPSSTPSRRALRTRFGREAARALPRDACAGSSSSLRQRNDADLRRASAREIGARRARVAGRTFAGVRPYARGAAFLRKVDAMDDFEIDWERIARTGTERSGAVRAQVGGADRRHRRARRRARPAPAADAARPAQVRPPLGGRARGARLRRGLAHGDPRRVAAAARVSPRRDRLRRHVGSSPSRGEAARTLAFAGEKATRFVDVGVAGLWRLMEHLDEIRRASASSSPSRAWRARCSACWRASSRAR